MVIRPVTPEEYPAVGDLFNIAFAVEKKPRDPADQQPDAHIHARAAFDDSGKMTAALELIPYTVWFEGHAVTMGGIGGVSSLPESRRQGNVRALMEHALHEMYDSGTLLSALFPFSHPFYRQFGYELAAQRRHVKTSFDAFSSFRSGDAPRQWLPGQDDAPIRDLYQAFAQTTNLAVSRDAAQWKNRLDGDPLAKRRYLYLWEGAHGNPRAYAELCAIDEDGGKALHMGDFAFADPGAMSGFFALLRSMGALYKSFVWDLPDWIDPFALFPEPYALEQSIETRGMARVVNVGEVLRLLKHPKAAGSYSLRITDPQLPENDGVWRVRYDEENVDVQKGEGQADWELDIPAFTQLVLGSHDVDSLLWGHPALQSPSNAEMLRSVFKRRRVYLADFF